MARFTLEQIDSLLGHPGLTPDLPEGLLARHQRGPRRQPWHQLQEVRDERDRWMARCDREHLRYHEAHDEAARYRTAFRLAAEERDRYAEALRTLAESADPLTRDKALGALRESMRGRRGR